MDSVFPDPLVGQTVGEIPLRVKSVYLNSWMIDSCFNLLSRMINSLKVSWSMSDTIVWLLGVTAEGISVCSLSATVFSQDGTVMGVRKAGTIYTLELGMRTGFL